jgi:D-alanyl-D-alanine carboxypeptidase (penicillin-binding protein 5/6)
MSIRKLARTGVKAWVLLVFSLAPVLQAQPAVIPAPPGLSAKAYILMDANSGKVIVEHNADDQLPPASLTKLMTSYVLSHELSAGRVSDEDMVTISNNAYAQNPVFNGSSLMWIEVGKQVSLADLHRGIVISSGNDASVAVAEHLAGSEGAFADLMNKHAEILGMKNSYFVNSHGLDSDTHYTTARDLALLARSLVMEYPESYSLYAEKSFTYNDITTSNRNGLLFRDPAFDGLKTGHTDAAGYCLVASAKKGGMRLITVVMGTASKSMREQETQKLATYGFRFYETRQQFKAGEQLADARVWGGAADAVALGVGRDVFLTVPRGRWDKLEQAAELDAVIKAPLTTGDQFGEMVVSVDGEEVTKQPLVALTAVDEGSLVKRLWDAIVLFVRGLLGY